MPVSEILIVACFTPADLAALDDCALAREALGFAVVDNVFLLPPPEGAFVVAFFMVREFVAHHSRHILVRRACIRCAATSSD